MRRRPRERARVIVLLGDTRSRKLIAAMRSLGWGRLFVASRPAPVRGEPWAIDNGVFGAWKRGTPWDERPFLRNIEAADGLPAPLFGVLPDIVGGGLESLRRSVSWLPRLPASWRWILPVQDGMRADDVAATFADGVGGLFLGGTDAFKATAPQWSRLAHDRGRWFHFARVSTANRLRLAHEVASDSVDTTQPLWSVDHWRRFEKSWRDIVSQRPLFAGGAA